MTDRSERTYDVVLFGATGFTGQLVARYFSRRMDHDLRWALAGRSRSKLEAVRSWLGAEYSDIDCVIANTDDEASIRAMVASTRVVLTTVGPYDQYGEVTVRACAELGTDYVDITGEPNFVTRIIRRYQQTAEQTGALLINCCGFDSIPADLGALLTVLQLPRRETKTVDCHVRTNAGYSGGTWASAVQAIQSFGTQSSPSQPRKSSRKKRRIPLVRRCPYTGRVLLKLPIIDPVVVKRSSRVHRGAYGKHFDYSHSLSLPSARHAYRLIIGVVLIGIIAKLPVVNRILRWVKPPGTGPSAEQRARSYFTLQFVGESPSRRVITEFHGGDPGYTETSKMLAECAILLATKRKKTFVKSGFTTPVGAFGLRLVAPLIAAGMSIIVVESEGYTDCTAIEPKLKQPPQTDDRDRPALT